VATFFATTFINAVSSLGTPGIVYQVDAAGNTWSVTGTVDYAIEPSVSGILNVTAVTLQASTIIAAQGSLTNTILKSHGRGTGPQGGSDFSRPLATGISPAIRRANSLKTQCRRR
jgi:hypothetical protein